MIKTRLTTSDIIKLNAARGLDMNLHDGNRRHQNRHGTRPSVTDYNAAIHQGVYIGDFIFPIGCETNP
jgi:hypothetical protein